MQRAEKNLDALPGTIYSDSMARRSLLVILLFFCIPWAHSEETLSPAVAGYVTAISSGTSFDVNGTHILCDGNTRFSMLVDGKKQSIGTLQVPYLGEPLDVYGRADKKTYTIKATEIIRYLPQPHTISGTAIIDGLPDASEKSTPGERLFRADGYRILVTAKTKTTFSPPLTSLAGAGTNVWLKYTGKERPDGTLIAETAVFTANAVPKGEDKLRTKNEYDPKSVDPSSKQGTVSKHVLGVNPKKIPPYEDAAMQARVDRIGLSLIPAYQRSLSDTDATKINFRFQLIDQPKWHDAMTLPNGIILVPRQVVDRLQNDSQLAAVLADNIAYALEKQSFRRQPADQEITAAQIASAAGEIFVPGLSLATSIVNSRVAASIYRHAIEQSGRVSLTFLHDAGYDIHEAPKAWWLLAPKKPKDMVETPLPERAAYLYATLGQTWRTTSRESRVQ
jgi:hypothetical protein